MLLVKNKYFSLCFSLPLTPEWWKRIPKMKNFESRDLCGDFKNGASENAHVNSKNEYWNEYGSLCQPIMHTRSPTGDRVYIVGIDHIQTVPSKQILSSSWLPLVWEATSLTHIDSAHYCHVKTTWVLFNNYNNVYLFWRKHTDGNAT